MDRKVKYYNSELKIRLILSRFSEENKCLLSVREAIRIDKYDLGIKISNWNYYNKQKSEVVDSEPYKGEPIDEKLIYKYVKEQGLIPKSMKFQDFINTKELHKLNDGTVIRMICEKLDWVSPKDIFSYDATIKTLEEVYSIETVDRVRQEVIAELLSR
jgi:hypothetical protein